MQPQTAIPTQLVRRYLPQLARLIHPDYFSSNPSAQSTNLASLQTLNSLISTAFPQSSSSIPPSSPLPKPTSLSFYLKPTDSQTPPKLITHTLSTQPAYQSSSFNKPLPTAHLAASFLTLCSKAGIQISQPDLESLSKLLVPTSTSSPFRRQSQKSPTYNALREEFQSAIRDNVSYRDLYQDSITRSPPKGVHLPPLLRFSASLTSVQKSHAEAQWKQYLSSKHHDDHDEINKTVPVLIVSRKIKQEGVLVVPWHLEGEELKQFLREELPRVHAEIREREKMSRNVAP